MREALHSLIEAIHRKKVIYLIKVVFLLQANATLTKVHLEQYVLGGLSAFTKESSLDTFRLPTDRPPQYITLFLQSYTCSVSRVTACYSRSFLRESIAWTGCLHGFPHVFCWSKQYWSLYHATPSLFFIHLCKFVTYVNRCLPLFILPSVCPSNIYVRHYSNYIVICWIINLLFEQLSDVY